MYEFVGAAHLMLLITNITLLTFSMMYRLKKNTVAKMLIITSILCVIGVLLEKTYSYYVSGLTLIAVVNTIIVLTGNDDNRKEFIRRSFAMTFLVVIVLFLSDTILK